MPNVTAPARVMQNGEMVTQFTDTASTTATTFTYPNQQEGMNASNKGVASIMLTVSGENYTIQPGQNQSISAAFTSFTIQSTSGTQQFEASAWSYEKDATQVKTFQELKNAVKSGFNTIDVAEGIYVFTEILRLKSNTHLLGRGNVTFKGNGSINALLVNDATNIGGYNDNANIIIENITFDGENTTNNTTLIGMGHANNIFVKKCRFKNLISWHMVEFNGVYDGYIENCVFENYAATGTIGGSPTESIQLDLMNDIGAFPWSGFVFDKTPCKNIFIRNNTFKNINRGSSAIGNHLFVAGYYPSNVFVENNTFENVDTCFTLHDCKKVTISENVATNCIWFVDISNKQNTIEEIIIKGNIYRGTYSQTTTGSNTGRFVGINKATNVPAEKIQIIGNSIINAEIHGVGLTANKVLIANNEINTCLRNGIYFYGGDEAVISNNIITNTNIALGGNSAIRVGDNASLLTKNVNVIGNTVDSLNIDAATTQNIGNYGNLIKA